MKIVLATGNKDKISEIREIMKDTGVELTDMSEFSPIDIVEDGNTFYLNARKKAYEAAIHTGLPALADDSGLAVDALEGKPGIYSARYSGKNATSESNNEKLIKALESFSDRKAKFICMCVLYFPDGRMFKSRGEIEGVITREPLGEKGFGYDPLFFLPERRKTMAELKLDEKNAISHRGKAFGKMSEIITQINKEEEKRRSKKD